MKVAALYVHPVKSARAVEVQEAEVTPTGLEGDRRFMIVDERGVFVTQRERPEMARLRATIDAGSLKLMGDDRRELTIPLDQPGPRVRVRVWDDEVEAIDCGAEAAGLVTTHIGDIARLVRFADDVKRAVDQTYAEPGDIVSFADGFPVLVATTASLEATLGTVGVRVDGRRFRPNIVIDGAAPFAEDDWSEIQIGEVRIALVKPCSRCTMVDVDPDQGRRKGGVLAQLSRTRRVGNRVLFGQNGIPRSLGRIKVGDPVVAIAR